MPSKIIISNLHDIIKSYNAGEGINSIHKRTGYGRKVIARALSESGVVLRSNTEANRLLAAARTPEQRREYSAAAHAAIRGKRYSPEELCKRAASRERSFRAFTSEYERLIAEELTERGIDFIPQKAVG